jgi:lipopolysaccharide/colanic/teichoic acid biosynthesis glycosyltransferase
VLLFVLMPFILFGNGINNKGNYFIRKSVSGMGYSLFKLSMKNDSESDGAVFSTNGDNRVTAFEIYAQTRIDEFLNFLMY